MAPLNGTQPAGKKRKRSSTAEDDKSISSLHQDDLEELERLATDSPKHFNNIAKIMGIAYPVDAAKGSNSKAITALGRIFYRLLMDGRLRQVENEKMEEKVVRSWLQSRLDDYVQNLLLDMGERKTRDQLGRLKILLLLVQGQVTSSGHDQWRQGIFGKVLHHLLSQKANSDEALQEFIHGYFIKYEDVRIETLMLLTEISRQLLKESIPMHIITDNYMRILVNLGEPPKSNAELTKLYLSSSSADPKGVLSSKQRYLAKMHRKWGQEAWIQLFQLPLQRAQQQQVLRLLVGKVIPWVYHAERLMDFLTNCFNAGGEMSLLALAGLFHLMQEKNLDYPSFYQKLYSLLDDELLHSKNRSRFFRLFDTFMSSTHLPAILVASFIKRLSRLALYAPPPGIVVVVPWIYNMFQRHPSCTFMMHREVSAGKTEDFKELTIQDPFNMQEKNPMETGAIDSCVWELIALQSHYHPNVATLAKIISEQFTKQQYNLEDFLDYSYKLLIDAELGKIVKKTPVVEYQIPPVIFSSEDGSEGTLGQLLGKVLSNVG